MLNTAMNLLRQVHEHVEIGVLPIEEGKLMQVIGFHNELKKDFWIQLGMLYKAYREYQEVKDE